MQFEADTTLLCGSFYRLMCPACIYEITKSPESFEMLSRILHATEEDMKHHGKIKLPNGQMLVPLEGYGTFNVGDLVFRPYYVSSNQSTLNTFLKHSKST